MRTLSLIDRVRIGIRFRVCMPKTTYNYMSKLVNTKADHVGKSAARHTFNYKLALFQCIETTAVHSERENASLFISKNKIVTFSQSLAIFAV